MHKKWKSVVFHIGFDEIADLLIQRGADTTIVENSGDTALSHAAKKGKK